MTVAPWTKSRSKFLTMQSDPREGIRERTVRVARVHSRSRRGTNVTR